MTGEVLEPIAISNDNLPEAVFLVETQDRTKLIALAIRLALIGVILLSGALMAPDAISETVITQPLSSFPIVNDSFRVEVPTVSVSPLNQFLDCAIYFNTSEVPAIYILMDRNVTSVGVNEWFTVFTWGIIDLKEAGLTFYVPSLHSTVVASFRWTMANSRYTVFCGVWRVIPAVLLVVYFISTHRGLSKVKVPFGRQRMLTLVLCISAVLWNDPGFIVHFFVPSRGWIVLDGLLKDQFYAISGFCSLAFLSRAPTDIEVLMAVIFCAAFGLMRGLDDVMNPVDFRGRISRFHGSAMLGFALIYVVSLAVTAFRAYTAGAKPGLYAYCVFFACYLGLWMVFLAVGSLEAIRRSALDALLSSVIVNVFAAGVIALHGCETRAESLYRAPGVGDDEENPFEFASDDAVDPGTVVFGALSLI
jgi:hypothetical protein